MQTQNLVFVPHRSFWSTSKSDEEDTLNEREKSFNVFDHTTSIGERQQQHQLYLHIDERVQQL